MRTRCYCTSLIVYCLLHKVLVENTDKFRSAFLTKDHVWARSVYDCPMNPKYWAQFLWAGLQHACLHSRDFIRFWTQCEQFSGWIVLMTQLSRWGELEFKQHWGRLTHACHETEIPQYLEERLKLFSPAQHSAY